MRMEEGKVVVLTTEEQNLCFVAIFVAIYPIPMQFKKHKNTSNEHIKTLKLNIMNSCGDKRCVVSKKYGLTLVGMDNTYCTTERCSPTV